MKYIFLIYNDPAVLMAMTEEQQHAEFDAYMAFNGEARAHGLLVSGEALQPPYTATTVRVREGQTLTTDGPFAETKEYLGGIYILDCKDLDEAIDMATKIPSAKHSSVEIRPIMEIPS
ncbi:MAG: YciI family protein [Anaerolineae bacterium]